MKWDGERGGTRTCSQGNFLLISYENSSKCLYTTVGSDLHNHGHLVIAFHVTSGSKG